jgi:hypothetical protein
LQPRPIQVQRDCFKTKIEIEGDARQQSEVFHQRKEREENCHRRQHHRHDPEQNAQHAIDEHADDFPGNMKRAHTFGNQYFKFVK